MFEASLEVLTHYQCDVCSAWWSMGDRLPENQQQVHCPNCGETDAVRWDFEGLCDVMQERDIQGRMVVDVAKACSMIALLENAVVALRSLPGIVIETDEVTLIHYEVLELIRTLTGEQLGETAAGLIKGIIAGHIDQVERRILRELQEHQLHHPLESDDA